MLLAWGRRAHVAHVPPRTNEGPPMSDAEPVLLIDRRGPVAVVTLNRPQAMNALSRELRRELYRGFVDLNEDDSISAVVLTGAGRAFTAGLDLKELGRE